MAADERSVLEGRHPGDKILQVGAKPKVASTLTVVGALGSIRVIGRYGIRQQMSAAYMKAKRQHNLVIRYCSVVFDRNLVIRDGRLEPNVASTITVGGARSARW